MVSSHTVLRNTHTLIAVHRPAVLTNGNQGGNTSLFRYQVSTPFIVFPLQFSPTPRGYVSDAAGQGPGTIDDSFSTLLENSVTTSLNIIEAVIASGSQIVYNNGAQQNSTTLTLASTTSPSLSIGFFGPGASQYYQGDIAEMIVYSSNITTPQRQQVEGYLAAKWGLQSSLPTSHPFRAIKP
jgi:hypothetical protein